ncbi:EpsG family protein [Oribacterium sp. P6A1]|uniref:EpsG family protein n=1 Tax=Oribacterium sp. P6A1 TaxID=1410612 RepID=UPI00055EBAEA|nr:EpsG family protein [Oribacterium sp. P6A1]
MTYIILILITVPLAYLWQKKEESGIDKTVFLKDYAIKIKSDIYAMAAFLPVFLIYALQCSVHSDYDNYQIMYSMVSVGRHAVRDPAVYSIFRIFTLLGLPFQSVYVFIYFVAFVILGRCIKDYSTDYALSLSMFITIFFMLGFYYIRQLVAVMIVLYAYRYIRSGKFIRYFILILIASAFHTSALVMIPGYFLLHYRFTTSFYITAGSLFAILNALKETVLTWIVATFIPKYFGRHEMFRSFAFGLYDTIWILFLIFVTLFFVFGLKRISGIKTEELQARYEGVFLGGLAFYFILYFFGRWILEFERFGTYFYIPVIVLYPHMLYVISEAQGGKLMGFKELGAQRIRVLLKLISYMILIAVFYFNYHADAVWNYRSIFSY